uniref:Integrase core domain containing protein n=1 Tax=Solanum tuberosum TaxID=4113 RepID=M1DW25_SOLTU
MAKIMTQLDILSKNVMGAGAQGVNAVGVGCVNPNETKFEALYNEEVNFLANQRGGYHSNYPRQGGNQGWKDRDREWRDRNPTWKEREGEKDGYVPPHERQKPKDSEGGGSEDMLSRTLNKVEGLASWKSSRQLAEEVCETDLDRRWTQDILKLESVKFGEPRSNLANRQPGAAGLNLGSWVESRRVGSFGELGRARRITRWFVEVPLIAFNFMFYLEKGSVTFGEKPEFAECTRRLAEDIARTNIDMPPCHDSRVPRRRNTAYSTPKASHTSP